MGTVVQERSKTKADRGVDKGNRRNRNNRSNKSKKCERQTERKEQETLYKTKE